MKIAIWWFNMPEREVKSPSNNILLFYRRKKLYIVILDIQILDRYRVGNSRNKALLKRNDNHQSFKYR